MNHILDVMMMVPFGTHEGALTYESYLISAILCWCAALVIVLLCWKKRLPNYYLFLSASILTRAIFSALLTISAGPDPMYDRAQLVQLIRVTNLASNIAVMVWITYLVKEHVKIEWQWRKNDAIGALMTLAATIVIRVYRGL